MIRIETLGRHGDGLARVDGATVAYPLTAPGDMIDRNGHVLTPSPHRRAPECPHFGQCGGCTLQHVDDETVAAWKRGLVVRALEARGLAPRILPAVTVPPSARRRVVLSAVRGGGQVLLGFSARASHDLVPVHHCTVACDAIVSALPLLRELASLGLMRKRPLRLTVTLTRAGLDIMVGEAIALDLDRRIAVAALAERGDFARVAWNDEIVVARRRALMRFGPVDVVPPPGAFLQAAAEGEAVLRRVVLRGAADASHVADLFAGCGTFSFPLAAVTRVDAFEAEGAMVAAMEQAARTPAGLKPFRAERRDLFRNPLTAEMLGAYDAVVIDPPRAGAAAQIAELARSVVPRIVHLSCSPESFARDAATLVAGGYRLGPVLPLDQFRWSAHVELAAVFSRC